MVHRVKLALRQRRGSRPELFDADSPYAADMLALLRDWDLLQARYEHLPEFQELMRRYHTKHVSAPGLLPGTPDTAAGKETLNS